MPRRRQLPRPASSADSHFHARGLDVFFNSKRADVGGDLVQRLVDYIGATEKTLDCAIYDLRAPEIVAALKQVARSRKKLRIAYDGGAVRTGGLMADPKPSGTAQTI